MTRLRVGLSTCPNDTFLFAPLLEGRVDRRGLDLELQLADVEELNQALVAGSLHVSKASFATALELSDSYGVLRVGSALGFGVGPVLLGRPGTSLPTATSTVLCPGAGTTATLLMGCLYPEVVKLQQTRFDRIMPALLDGRADAGVCIHEGRFSYAEQGLELLDDLGLHWESMTGGALPLGGLLARLDLGEAVHRTLNAVLAESLAMARADVPATLPTMRRWAQELDDELILRHVELYVTDATTNLGAQGRRCLDELALRCGRGAAPAILG